MVAKGIYPGAKENCVPLSDGAGEVVEVGEDVTDYQRGDRVLSLFHRNWFGGRQTSVTASQGLGALVDGTAAQYVVFDAQSVIRCPSQLSYEEGATLVCAGLTAYHALYSFAPLVKGQTVLLLGTGGVSIFGLSFAKLVGCQTIITSSSDEKLQQCKALGATHTINYKTHPDWEKEVRKIVPDGADVILEVGGAGTLLKSVKSIKHGGLIAEIGALAQLDPDDASKIFGLVLFNAVRLQGLLVGSKEDFQNLIDRFYTEQTDYPKPVIDKVFEFDQLTDALEYQLSGSHLGKVVVRCSH